MTEADPGLRILAVDATRVAEAADLLARFLVDEGFATAPAEIEGHLRAALGDGIGWAALASLADRHVGVATVQLSRSIELGLPAEIGDLWVEPGCRGRGIARALVDACSAWAAGQGSRSIQVTVTAEGAGRHGLDGFYDRLGFPDEGRRLRMRALEPTGPALRLASAADQSVAERLVEAAYAPYVPRLGRRPAPMVDDYRMRIARAELWLADLAGQPVGLVVLEPRIDHLLLDNVAVAAGLRGRGVGRALIAFAEREARRRGYVELRLFTNALMTENQAIYRHLGYVETRREQEHDFCRVHFAKAV